MRAILRTCNFCVFKWQLADVAEIDVCLAPAPRARAVIRSTIGKLL